MFDSSVIEASVTSGDGKTLLVMRADGSNQRRVNLPDLAAGFIASEHG
jgi:hypothetical protein